MNTVWWTPKDFVVDRHVESWDTFHPLGCLACDITPTSLNTTCWIFNETCWNSKLQRDRASVLCRNHPGCMRLGRHCAVLDFRWFNSTSFCTSQSFMMESQIYNECAHTVWSLTLSDLFIDCCQLKFSSSKPGLFTSNYADKAEVCAILFVETPKNKRCWHI